MRLAGFLLLAVLVWDTQHDCDTYRVYAEKRQTAIMPGQGWRVELSCQGPARWEIPEALRGYHFAITAVNSAGESGAAFIQDIDGGSD